MNKVKIVRKGDYIKVWDINKNFAWAVYSKRTKKMWGATKYFPMLKQALKKK